MEVDFSKGKVVAFLRLSHQISRVKLSLKVLLDLDTYDSSNKAYISFGQSLLVGAD